MKRFFLRTFAFAVACGAAVTPLRAGMVTLGASADASLFEYQPDNNMGGMLDLPAGSLGKVGAYRTRALFKFDLAGQIPAGATIDAVSLTLESNLEPSDSATGSTFGLHRVLADWGEGEGTGNQGRSALAGEVTWNSRQHGAALWSDPGGRAGTDYVTTSSAATYVSGLGSFQWMSTGLAGDVQAWLDDPSTNHGWMLITESEDYSYTAKRFGAREIGTAAKRPQLKIEFTVIPEPTTAGLLVAGLAALAARRWRAGSARSI